MRVFVYEFVTAGGTLGWRQEAPASLLVEGSAMVAAVAVDFGLLAEVQVSTMRDRRLPAVEWAGCEIVPVESAEDEAAVFLNLVGEADAVLLIAPETGGELLRRCRVVESLGRELLSPGSATVELAGNKQATAEWLGACGVRVPEGGVFRGGEVRRLDRSGSWVVKPLDGCGSQDVRLVAGASELAGLPVEEGWRLERNVRGMAASVAVLCGPAGRFALPTCEQRLSRDGRFKYLGGRLPVVAELDQRARTLAAAAVATLPAARGYVGVDLVLGAAADGSEDYVIEINPRLTTSYIGLRAAAGTNLAAAMLDVCRGRRPDLWFDERAVEFSAEGRVWIESVEVM